MAALDNLSEHQFFRPIVSDSGSLLDADLVATPGGADEHAQTIYDLAHAHATSAASMGAIRSQYPFVTRLSDFSDAAIGMGAQAGQAAIKSAHGALAGLGHEDPFRTQHLDSPEATGRAARDAIHPY